MTIFGAMLSVILIEAVAIVGLLAESSQIEKEYKRRLQEQKKGV